MINKTHVSYALYIIPVSIITLALVVTSPMVFAQDANRDNGEELPRGAIFSSLLPDLPGMRITVFELNFEPRTSERKPVPHRHPGSVYIYVTSGALRLGLEGKGVTTVQAGESFFEPAGVVHTLTENVSTTEPASAIAVMVLPDGEAPSTPVSTGD